MFLATSYVAVYLRFDVLAGVNVKFVLFRDGVPCSLIGRYARTYTASHSVRNLISVDCLPKLLTNSQLLMNCFLKILPLSLKSLENILRHGTVDLISVCFILFLSFRIPT